MVYTVYYARFLLNSGISSPVARTPPKCHDLRRILQGVDAAAANSEDFTSTSASAVDGIAQEARLVLYVIYFMLHSTCHDHTCLIFSFEAIGLDGVS